MSIDPKAVRKYLQPLLDEANKVGPIPMPGSPAWCELPDDDPRKPVALFLGATWWADQHTPEALAERAEFDEYEERRSERMASWAISGAIDWGRSHPSFGELKRLRATYPPLRPMPDPAAVARWVRTGSSADKEAAA